MIHDLSTQKGRNQYAESKEEKAKRLTKKVRQSIGFRKQYNQLHKSVIDAIKKALGGRVIKFEVFEDEANNDLEAVCKDGVYCTDPDLGEDGLLYPLKELGITDALEILSIIERTK